MNVARENRLEEASAPLSPAQAVYFKNRNLEKRREVLAAKAAAWHAAIRADVLAGVDSAAIGTRHGLAPHQTQLLILLRKDFTPGQVTGPAPDLHAMAALTESSANTARKWTRIFGFSTADDLEKAMRERGTALLRSDRPSIRGAARELGVDKATVNAWARRLGVHGQGRHRRLDTLNNLPGEARRQRERRKRAEPAAAASLVSIAAEIIPAPPPAPAAVSNFFESLYQGRRINAETRQADTAFSARLTEAGLFRPQDLLDRRARDQMLLNITNRTLKKLEKRVEELGANQELQIGLFSAGVRTAAAELAPIGRDVSESYVCASAVATQRYALLATPSLERPAAPANFAKADLNVLSSGEERALRHFIRRLFETARVRDAIQHCPVGGTVDGGFLAQVPIGPLLRPAHGQPEKAAERAVRDLMQMGALAPDRQLSPAFVARFHDVVVWHIKHITQQMVQSERPQRYGPGGNPLAPSK